MAWRALLSLTLISVDAADLPPCAGAHEAVTTPELLTHALSTCSTLTLRLGFHAASNATNAHAAHGIATALYAIRLAGGAANASFRPVSLAPPAALRGALQLIQEDRVHAVIGGGSSAIAALGQSAFGLAGVPQIAYSSTASSLRDRSFYPTFSRVVPNDHFQALALARLCEALGWRAVALVSSSDEYGRGMAAAFGEALRRGGGRALLDATLEAAADSPRHAASVLAAVAGIADSAARVVALFCGNVGGVNSLLRAARAAGVRPAYLGSDGWLSAQLDFSELQLIGTSPRAPSSGAAYEAFVRAWRAAPSVGEPSLECDAACRGAPGWTGMYAYDATRLLHRAWTLALLEGRAPHNLSSGVLLSAIRTARLPDGLTSTLTMDASGELLDGSYDLLHASPLTQGLTRVGVVTDGRVQFDAPLQFVGGVPLDGTQPSPLSSRVLPGAWQTAPAGGTAQVAVELFDSFGRRIAPLERASCAPLQLQLRLARLEAPLASFANASVVDAERNGSSARLCSVAVDVPSAAEEYFLRPLLGADRFDQQEAELWLRPTPPPAARLSAALWAPLLAAALLAAAAAAALAGWKLRAARRSSGGAPADDSRAMLALFCNPRISTADSRKYGIRPLALGQDLKHLLRSMPAHLIAIEPAATLLDAQAAFEQHRPRIVSFSGHTFAGMLAFEDEKGRLDKHVDPEEFAKLITGRLVDPLLGADRSTPSRKRSLRDKPMPKGRQPGELAGFTPLMGDEVYAQIGKQSSAINRVHKVVLGLKNRDEAISYLRSLERSRSRGKPPRVSTTPSRTAPAKSRSSSKGDESFGGLVTSTDDSLLNLRRKKYGQLTVWGGFRAAHVREAQRLRSPPMAEQRSFPQPAAAPFSIHAIQEATMRRARVMQVMRRLECVILSGCETEQVGRRLLKAAPNLTVICWSTLAEDSATRVFTTGLYEGIARMLQRRPSPPLLAWLRRAEEPSAAALFEMAFHRGCKKFLEAGYAFGDPMKYLHERGHPHWANPEFHSCQGCTPPVHGQPLLMRVEQGEVRSILPGADLAAADETSLRRIKVSLLS